MLRNDNGGEYNSNDFILFCQNHGIGYQFMTPHTPNKMEFVKGRIGH